jgi:glycosyltransferase involved in cell wall biosynthesis
VDENKLKILWFCGRPLCDINESRGTASWLGAMSRGLLESEAVELGVIAFERVGAFIRRDYRQSPQWLVPAKTSLDRRGMPPASMVRAILAAAEEFSPDLIHIWGVETFFGMLTARGLLKYPSLLEIQGLKGPIADVFYGGLTLQERLRCIGIKEILKRRTMHADRRDFARWGVREKEIIRGHHFVDVHSTWVISQIKAANPDAQLFVVDRPLRLPFYHADAWQAPRQPVLFTTAAYTSPFKGLHMAVRALALLRKRIPDARLRIAGSHQRPGIRQDGYIRWINRQIGQLGLSGAIEWLGPLNAEQLVTELQNAAAMMLPTFVETYCLALAEAMRVGTPSVVAYTGGTGYLGKDEETCLFFPPGDANLCAHQLERVLTDGDLAQRLSRESRKVALIRNDRQRIVRRQLEIYRQILHAH